MQTTEPVVEDTEGETSVVVHCCVAVSHRNPQVDSLSTVILFFLL